MALTRNNNQSNRLIKWLVTFSDFVLLNMIILGFARWHWRMSTWPTGGIELFFLASNMALFISLLRFSTIIHLRLVGAGDVLKRIIELTVTQAVLAYLLLKIFAYNMPIGWLVWQIGTVYVLLLMLKRLIERWFIKLYREAGRNSRGVILVGSDPELINVFYKLQNDPTLGYSVRGYYGDESLARQEEELRKAAEEKKSKQIRKKAEPLERIGSFDDLMEIVRTDDDSIGVTDELYLCISRTEKATIRQISRYCDHHVIRFFYVPVSVETIGLNLKREMLDDMEIYTTYDNPLQNSVNKAVKRVFDIVLSIVFLIPTALLYPFVWLIIKIQSPGPILFKQERTGLDGKTFKCYKFRSMHVNKDADKLQATKDDPRKFPFGNFMRKSNIDELPQFFNVLQGRMSIVGPRPHMLAHTEEYSKLIDKYMVRHFVKPGVTGWAQVTGYRGETKELWQMEGRIRRDIWYMENWSIWLDVRIIWKTAKSIFVHDKNAY